MNPLYNLLHQFRNLPLRVHWSVALFPLAMAWMWMIHDPGDFWGHLSFGFQFSVLLYVAGVFPHELAHWAVGRGFGVKGRITLVYGGGLWMPDDGEAFLDLSKGCQALIFLAGPAANFLITFFSLYYQNHWSEFGQWVGSLGILNLWLGCVNLLPVVPLDGGRVFHLLLRAVPLKGWGMVGLSFLPVFGLGLPAWCWLLYHRIWLEVILVGLGLLFGCWVLWEERHRLLRRERRTSYV
ncbi:MAG: site-2 protease family protein [Verrucomicrobia bacterium]|nr:site-2 protease family protein [Verrucomicrobiota bacterium]MCH8510939.1 site-2 protease family protein [Kiritimatiellia bacterium]